MNRLLWSTDKPIPTGPQALPPAERSPGSPARILFFNGSELGFSTSARTFEVVCAERTDIDAVHVRVPIRGLLRVAGARVPKRFQPWALGTTRLALANGAAIARLFRTVLPLDRFDVVHFMTQQRAWALTNLAGHSRTKFAVNIDATVPGWCRQFGWARSPLNLDARVEKRIIQRADLVVCASRWVSDSAMRDSGARSDHTVLNKPCALFDPHLPFRTHDESPPRGTPGGALVRIVFVGNDWERKGGPRLLRWHQEHWTSLAEVHVCSATAPRDQSLKNVVWHGPTPREKLLGDILPQMDFMAMPTSNDTFLIAAQEAQCAGLPVVTSRLAGIPEVVRHGRTGLLCPPESDQEFIAAIQILLTDHAKRRAMGLAARAFAMTHLNSLTWHNNLFDQLVALADGRPLRFAPEGIDLRRSDQERANPQSAAESLALSEIPA